MTGCPCGAQRPCLAPMISCDHPVRRAAVWPNGRVDVVDAPVDEAMRVVDEMVAKWKTTLTWLADR